MWQPQIERRFAVQRRPQVTQGCSVVDAKSNEITAIPKLLQIIEPSGCLVTTDGMGCQVEIARTTVDAGADYVPAVKDNRPTMAEGVVAFFAEHPQDDFARVEVRRQTTKGHGRQKDLCRIRKGNADANVSTLRRTASSLLKNNHSEKAGIKNKRLLAALDDDYLQEVLFGN